MTVPIYYKDVGSHVLTDAVPARLDIFGICEGDEKDSY